jgi:predicted ATP-binding protein involved in virulence
VRVTLGNGDHSDVLDAAYPDEHFAAPPVGSQFLVIWHAGFALVAYYAATRGVAKAADALRPSQSTEQPQSAIFDALDVAEVKYRSLFLWFNEREIVENAAKVKADNLRIQDPQLSAVRRAVEGMLDGFSGLRIERDDGPLHMVVRKGDTILAIDQLSDGEKNHLALCADLARRLAITYPSSPDPLQGEAIVLIDEIELHLHPNWQRKVLADLHRVFPNCQFIVTTHSPQVLSEVPNDAVILVKDFKFHAPATPTAGRDSNAILSYVMGSTERPEKQLEAIREVSELLDAKKFDVAREKLDALANELSEHDREVVGLRTMLHFMDDGDETAAEGE